MIALFLVSLVVLAVIFAWWNTQYWKRRGINGPESKLFIGNLNQLGDITEDPMPYKLAEWTQKYGKVYGFQRGCRNALVLSDISMAKEVFVDQFENFHERDLNPFNGDADKKSIAHVFNARGLRWKRLRTLTSLVFTTKSLKKVFPIVVDCADKMCQNLEEDLEKTQVINLAQNLKEYTSDVILRSAFGRQEDRKFIQDMIESVIQSFNQFRGLTFYLAWAFPPIGSLLGFLTRLSLVIFNRFFSSFFKQVRKDVKFRKEVKEKNYTKESGDEDFIDLLVDVESDDVILQNASNYDKKNSSVQKKLTKDEILGTSIVFLVAGFDTTANTLAFTCFHLAKNQEIQDKVRKEIEEHCQNDKDIDYDSLNQLKYLDVVMKETLRLHPIASGFTSRRCSKSTKIGNLEIEQGTDILLDVISMHQNKEVWGEDAEEYRPERWIDEDSKLGNFYGFGDGLRSCVGMRFAQLEHKMLLIKLLQKYRICEVEETKEAEQIQGLILGPKSLKVKLEKI